MEEPIGANLDQTGEEFIQQIKKLPPMDDIEKEAVKNGHNHDICAICELEVQNAREAGRLEERKKVLQAIETWKKQGRDPHDLWAMDNFLSGSGSFITQAKPE